MSGKKVCAFLAIAFMVLLAATSAGAEALTDANGRWTYTLEDGGATITGYVEEPTGDLIIPSELDGYPVTGIGYEAFAECKELTSMTIPYGVTSIGGRAFMYCVGFTDITIPDSVTNIGDGAFMWCVSLAEINVPDSVTNVGDGAFKYCEGLTVANIPDSLPNIAGGVFSDCYSLTHITIPQSVSSIGEESFYWCDSLAEVIIPDSVMSIGSEAFALCSNVADVTLSQNLTVIRNGLFYGCDLINVIIPDSVTVIESEAFAWCANLTSVTIPNSVTSIGENVFMECPLLTLSVEVGSYAEQFAKENGIRYVLTPDATAETADELLVKQIDEFFTMTKAEILEKLGSGFIVVPAGPEGACDGYYYEDLGMAFAFYPDNDTLELIDCFPGFMIHGVGTGNLFSEILEALGDTEIVETWLELPIYTAYMVRYRFGNAEYSFIAFEEDAPVHILWIHQTPYVDSDGK